MKNRIFQEAVDALKQYGSATDAAIALKIPRTTLASRLERAKNLGLKAKTTSAGTINALKREISALEQQLRLAERERLTVAYVRKYIFDLAAETPRPPKWTTSSAKKRVGSPGVPCTMWSDWHWGEVVNKNELGGVNEFNMEIAHARAQTLFDTTIDLLKNHTVNPDYPGIVVNLGGDMVTGDIHEELTNTNDAPIMPTVVDVFGVLARGLEQMADAFGNVFIPCVTGNHGRNTRKIQHKQRAFTNFDWLLYSLLEKHFVGDKRLTFCIPESSDAVYRVYNHRYLLSHGDQFRGGDGIIGPIGPIMRGDNKKRSRNSQVGLDYDTMVIGHFHTLMQLPRLIVNGSLKGYDEYAYDGNFSYEPPAQALWFTHPELGITYSMPVYVERKPNATTPEWVTLSRRS